MPDQLREAAQLLLNQRYEEARHLYERWLSAHPDDPDPTFNLGYTFYLQACAESSPTKARPLRLHARELLEKARRLGSRWPELVDFADAITPEGDDARRYDATPAAAELIRRGETAFSAGRFDEALDLYQQALVVDRHAYPAALFIGDVYFYQKKYAKANEWFSKAVGIDPTIETAFRYWGDSLLRESRLAEARERYLEAIVAEPYSRLPQVAFEHFATITHLEVRRPSIKPFLARVEMVNGSPQITLDSAGNEPLTVAYAMARARWLIDERGKYFPADSAPRHSLPEEASALRTTLQIARELSEKDAAAVATWQDSLAELAALDKAGLLEAYILLDAADESIAKDYESYRFQHREQLMRYLRKIRCGGTTPQASAKN